MMAFVLDALDRGAVKLAFLTKTLKRSLSLMRMKCHSVLIKIRSPFSFLAVALTEDDLFLSKAEETYEAFLAELSKVLIKVL